MPMWAKMQRVANIFDCKNNYVSGNDHFESSISINISEPSFDAVLTSTGGETIEPESSTDLYLDLTDELTGKTMDRTVRWSVDNNGHISAYETKSGEAGKITLYGDKPGTYTVTAEYYTVQNQWKKVTKTVTVRKPEVKLEIMGPDTGVVNGYGEYWLQVKVDGKIIQNQSVTWGSWNFVLDKTTSESNSNEKVKVKYTSWAGNVDLFAKVHIGGDDYNVTKSIQVKWN